MNDGVYEWDCTNTVVWNDFQSEATSRKLLELARKFRKFRVECL